MPPLKHRDRVNSSRFSPDGNRLVTASWDKTVAIWDVHTGRPLVEPMRHDDYVAYAEFSPDGTRVVSASWDNTARVWDAQTGLLVRPLQHEHAVNRAHFSPDGKRIVTASPDWTAGLWDAQTGQRITSPLRHSGFVLEAEFSPDGKRVVTASVDKTARVWDAQTGQPLTMRLKHRNEIWFARFSPDGNRIVTTLPLTWRVWLSVAQFSPDGQCILTASGCAQIWDAQTGHPLTEPLEHTMDSLSSRSGANGKPGEAGPEDNSARIWDVGFVPRSLPGWLLRLAEAISGKRHDAQGVLEETSLDRAKTIAQIREELKNQPDDADGVTWGRWLLADPANRTLSPSSTVMVSTYLEHQIEEQTKASLEEAAQLASRNPELLQRISEARDHITQVESLGSNVTVHACAGQWDAVKADLSKLIEALPNEHTNYHLLAPLLVQSGDIETYRRHCAQVLARFGATSDPMVAERMAKDCLILPNPAIDLELVAQLADTAVTKGNGHSLFGYFEFAKGLSEYRQGHFQSAIDWVQKTLAEPDQDFRDAQANLVLAMAQHKCGKLAEARAALDKGARAIESKAPKPGRAAVGDNWGSDWIIARALLQEAKGLIESEKSHTPISADL
jgi:tetratricopeptide (TPR) repeat protein